MAAFSCIAAEVAVARIDPAGSPVAR